MSSLFHAPRSLNWYFSMVMPPPLLQASLEQEQMHQRRAFMLAAMATLLVLVLIVLVPACLFIPNKLTLVFILILLSFCCLCLLLNHLGKVLFTSYLLVGAFEATLMAIIATTRPFDTFNLPLYDFFALTDLLAISLLSWKVIVPLVVVNTLFIIGVVAFQPQTANLRHFTQMPLTSFYFYNIVIRPTSIQLVAIIVPLVWIAASTRAWERVQQAELMAEMERKRGYEQELLEQDIQQLLLLCLRLQSSGQDSTYQPRSQGHDLLLNAFLVLRAHLLDSQQIKASHQRHLQAIDQFVMNILANKPVCPSGTKLDMVALALRSKGIQPEAWKLFQDDESQPPR